jgi:hypothetical protein
MTDWTPPVRVVPPLPLPAGDVGHRFSAKAREHTWSSRECDPDSFHRERSEMRGIMRAVHCDLMRDAGDLLAAAYYRPPAITEGQVRQIAAIIVRYFGIRT